MNLPYAVLLIFSLLAIVAIRRVRPNPNRLVKPDGQGDGRLVGPRK